MLILASLTQQRDTDKDKCGQYFEHFLFNCFGSIIQINAGQQGIFFTAAKDETCPELKFCSNLN